ncbi:hypothetical protein EV702DRAFT_1196642 [Suillus placidus]|uniref:Uncharacterized protein n=1 Tax=Suillus placidus TaxID=48579 RepID=A0A9P6ZXA8_9AGAM|nr:hypothetical protein EV702DRAFT_1196642 [Suillus placidus]
MLPGWGDQSRWQGDQQNMTEQPPLDSHPFNFSPYDVDGYQDNYNTAPAGSSSQATSSNPDQSLWALQDYDCQSYHLPPQDHYDNDLGLAITVPTHYPQPSGHPLQDQLVHPRPHRLSDLVPPGFMNTWQQSHPIPAASAAASDAAFNPSFFQTPEPMLAIPSPTHPSDHASDDVVQHSTITHSRRPPKESSGATRSSRRSTRLAKSKSTMTKSSSAPSTELKIVPCGIQGFLGLCKEAIKVNAFGRSLLPSPDSLGQMVKTSWGDVARSQTDGVLQQWALDKVENYQILKLEPVLLEVLNDMKLNTLQLEPTVRDTPESTVRKYKQKALFPLARRARPRKVSSLACADISLFVSSAERPASPVTPSTQHSSKDSSDGLDNIEDHRGQLPGVFLNTPQRPFISNFDSLSSLSALTDLSEGKPPTSSSYPSALPKVEAPLIKLEPISARRLSNAIPTSATQSIFPYTLPLKPSYVVPTV